MEYENDIGLPQFYWVEGKGYTIHGWKHVGLRLGSIVWPWQGISNMMTYGRH